MTINLSSKVISKIYERKLPKNLGFATFNKVFKRLRKKLIFNAIIKSQVSYWKSTEDLIHFEESLQKSNDISSCHRSIQMLMIGLYKNQKWICFPNDGFNVKQRKCYLQFQKFARVSVEKKEKRFYSLETLSYRATQLWTLFSEKSKQWNNKSL